jgi:DNA-binding GntR family transcriptional regulator
MAIVTEAANDEAGYVSLTDLAYQRIEEDIVTLTLAPGRIVSEAQLSKRIGIGRTPIREALQRLAHAGLVVILPRRGILISEIDIRSQLQLLEVRREVERLVAGNAADRATESEQERFQQIAAEMLRAAETGDDRAFLRLDRELNDLSVEASRNDFAAKSMQLMQPLSRRFWFIHYQEVADLPLCARLHAEVARSIAEGDRIKACAAFDRLLDYIETFTRATLDAPRRIS